MIFLGVSFASAQPTLISGLATIVDGDTLDIGPVRIRLHGIDAPEAGQTCGRNRGHRWQCGTAATSRLAMLIEGQSIECEALDRDGYGRIVARCLQEGQDVSAVILNEGLVWAFTRYSDDYASAEAKVRANGIGIWEVENETPWAYRADRWNRAAAASPRVGCPIKGNIASDGERIYHNPWSPAYSQTEIDEGKGEKWFCNEAEAEDEGWRAARWR